MNILIKTIVYVKMSLKTFSSKPSVATLKDIVRFYPDWLQYLNLQRDSVKDKTPWLTFGAIQFIKKIARPEMIVFEYGSGGSTLFWAERVRKVISIEHNKQWYERMYSEFKNQQVYNVDYELVEAESDEQFYSKNPADPQSYLSTDKEFEGKNFKAYVEKIDMVPGELYDIVIVDGRARPSCILHSMDRLKPNGYLVIDNTDRNYYLSSFDFAKSKWRRWTFRGPVPYIYNFSETTIFQRLV